MITANGGGGVGPMSVGCVIGLPCDNGEGGGSGGAILLEAPSVSVAASGGLFANGGGGTCSAVGYAQDGQASTSVALGQKCTGQTGNGGDGAAAGIAAQNGGDKFGNLAVGGGGGGGLGRIRVNLPSGTSFEPQGVISGALTSGVLKTR